MYHLIIILSNHRIILLLFYCIIVLSKEQLACFTFSKPYNQIFQQFFLLFGCLALTEGSKVLSKSIQLLNLKHTHFWNYNKKDQQNLGRSLERRFQPEGSFKAPASKEGSKVVKINIFCSISYIRNACDVSTN